MYGSLTIDQALALKEMNEIRKKKMQGWRIELVKRLPLLKELSEPTIIGSFSYTQLASKRKLIQQSKARNYGFPHCTDFDLARDYLDYRYKGQRRRMTTEQWHMFVKNKPSAPLYCYPCDLDEAVYMDLKSAYWQIIRRIGWDVDYNRGKWLSKKSDNSDFPIPDNKLARNALVTAGLTGNIKTWHPDDKKLVVRKARNTHVNFMLWGCVMDILNSFASDMVSCCAVYVHTDGYIADIKYEKDMLEIADSWGLELVQKHRGKASVYGVGRYDIGKKHAGTLSVKRRSFNKLYTHSRFLRPRMLSLLKLEGV